MNVHKNYLKAIAVIACLLALTVSVFADEYINAETEDPYMGSDNAVNGQLIGGQKVDFEIAFENVQWIKQNCSPDGPMVTGLSFDVIYRWIEVDTQLFGLTKLRQKPSPNATNGPDFAYVYIDGPYVIDVTQTDSGTLANGLKGIKFDDIQEDQDQVTKHIVLKLRPEEPYQCCQPVPSVEVATQYFHTYDGNPEITIENSVDISGSIPPSISVGGSITFTNNYVWHKDAQETMTNTEGKMCDNILLGNPDCPCSRETSVRTQTSDCDDYLKSRTTASVCSTAQNRSACITQVGSCIEGNSQYSNLNPENICDSLQDECASSSSSNSNALTVTTQGPIEWLVNTVKQILNV